MAVRKASDSNLTGKKYNDASAATTKIADVPDAPTIGSVTGTVTPSVAFTAANRGGTVNSFTVTSTPGSITATGASSPITVNGLSSGTSYTFKVKGKNNLDNFGPESAASSAVTVTIPVYQLAQTFNTSTNYTVPSGVSKIGVVTISGGGSGSQGNGAFVLGANPGSGGKGGSAISFFGYDVNAAQNYAITVGGAGGTSSFGSLTSATTNGNATSNFNTNAVAVNSVNGGGGGSGAGANSASITYNIPDIGPLTINHGGGGGGGGHGGSNAPNQGAKGGGAGGASFGGSGGGGGQGAGAGGGGGGAGSGPGGGGGGGGTGGLQNNTEGEYPPGGAGGAGATGRILVYELK
jgi:hypothetical protein